MLDVCKLHSRTDINNAIREDESVVIKKLLDQLSLPIAHEALTKEYAQKLVHHLRDDVKPSLMETFLSKYGLSTDEGIALMCLAEALLRVPDGFTAEELIQTIDSTGLRLKVPSPPSVFTSAQTIRISE